MSLPMKTLESQSSQLPVTRHRLADRMKNRIQVFVAYKIDTSLAKRNSGLG